MKEIYILDSCYNPTSASTNRLLALGVALQHMGVAVTIFYLLPNKKEERCNRHTDVLNYIYLWEGSCFKNRYFNTIRSMLKFYKLMRPDIPVYVYSLLNCIYFLRLKKDIHLFHENTENPDVTEWSKGISGKLLYRLYIKTIPKLDGIFLITSTLRDKYIIELGAIPQKTFVLNMIVDRSRFEGLPDVKPNNSIAYCGILSEFKDGVSILVRAFARISPLYPEYKLKLIGPFLNKETENRLRLIVSELGLDNVVEFLGVVPPVEMPSILKTSKILALARPDNNQSQYGFATKIGEYLMTGRPIVITRVGAVEDYLTDMEDCILANPDDVEDFANKLIWAIKHYNQAKTIGLKGRSVVGEYFDSEKEVVKIFNVVNSSF